MFKNKIIKKIIAISFLLIFTLLNINISKADNPNTLGNLNKSAEGSYGTIDPNSIGQSLPDMAGRIIGTGLSLLGIIFLILIIYGGFIWMFARGDNTQITKAKELLEAAVIGLIIVMSAYAITAWLGTKLTT
jgi:hypothetical protein